MAEVRAIQPRRRAELAADRCLRVNRPTAAHRGRTEVRRLVERRAESLLSSASGLATGTDAGGALTACDALAADRRGAIEAAMYRTLRSAGRQRTDARCIR